MRDCTEFLVYSPPRCSAAGTGLCQRGQGWQWLCGRSWQGLGPIGSPGSQRPVFLKPTPKGQETKKEKEMDVIRLACSGSKLHLLLRQWASRNILGVAKTTQSTKQPQKTWQPTNTYTTLSCTARSLSISFHLAAIGWQPYIERVNVNSLSVQPPTVGAPRGEDWKFHKINNDRFIDSTPAELKRSSPFPTCLPMASRNENALGTLWETRALLNNTTAVSLGAY